MNRAVRVIVVVGCSLGSLCASGQVAEHSEKVVLPNPQIIHCRSAECSQLWKQEPGEGAVYPAQVLTDIVKGEVVGLTAVYDKLVSIKDLQSAINARYEKWVLIPDGVWRIKPEEFVIQLSERSDGTKQLIYLKLITDGNVVPAAHICGDNRR
jgi:hypothetical protein